MSNVGDQVDARLPRVSIFACVLVVFATVCSLFVFASRGAGLRFVSGTWTALAVDASQGMIYRPIIGPLGYGGSRYMPLHFVLHGGLIKITGDPLIAGYAITVLSAFGLLSGVYYLLRALGVGWRWAVCGEILCLASLAVQLAITTVRGDLLSAALNVWGLAIVAREMTRERPRISLATVLFVLAFAGKLTTLFGLAACVVTLFARGKRNAAARMIVLGAVGVLLVVGVTYVASGGRVIESMRVTGSGGAGFMSLIQAPLRLLYFGFNDLPFLPFFVAAMIAATRLRGAAMGNLAAQSLVWTLAATLFIYGSPGTDFNHLLDLHLACVVFLIVQMQQNALPRFSSWLFRAAGPFAAVVIVAANIALLFIFPASVQQDRLNAYRAAHTDASPVLSEDPWVPIVGGERPYNLDSFNLRLACMQDEKVRADLWGKLEGHFFSGIVLTPVEEAGTREFDLEAKWYGVPYYGGVHFPPGFIEQVYRYYEPATRFNSYLVLKPRR